MSVSVQTRVRRLVIAVFGFAARRTPARPSVGHVDAPPARENTGVRPPLVMADLIPPPGSLHAGLTRSEWLTPYGVETLREEALRLGPGTTLEVRVRDADDEELRRLHDAFAPLGRRGIVVAVRAATPRTPHEHAA